MRDAVVAGATGAVGAELVRRLLASNDYERVVALVRRPLTENDPRLLVVPAQFDALDHVLSTTLTGRTNFDAFCCLGTTIRTAGSRAAFQTVDHDYVLAFARWALDHQARRLVVVSALGADASSGVFYNRVKGETETALRALGFGRNALVIVRPSLLDAQRADLRVGERLALAVARPLRALIPARVRPIRVEDVAQSMLDAALARTAPTIIESETMQGAATASNSKRPGVSAG
ncbi:MAG: NAD(P)H-binding protein [Burkholderiaceae bacterium]